jgi:hypothetical protein
VEGPIRRGSRLGSAIVTLDGMRAAAVPLLAARAIPRADAFDRLRGFVREHWIWLVVAASVILITAVLLWHRRRRRARARDEMLFAEESRAVTGQGSDGGAG